MKIKFEINKDLVINVSSYYDKNCKVIRIYLIITNNNNNNNNNNRNYIEKDSNAYE